MDWIIGLGASAVVAIFAYRRSSLSFSGMMAAMLMGTLYYALGSMVWYGTLLAFFISSTLLSKVKKRMKASYEANYEKTGRRDAGQVFANGGIGMVLCVLYAIWPEPLILWAYIGVMATVTADTWATEIGSLSRAQPRSVLTWKQIPTGTSGGISALGTSAAVAGGLFIGCGAVVFQWFANASLLDWPEALLFIAISMIAGTAGAMVDSVMGATVQVMYRCSQCGSVVERRDHCGHAADHIRGLRWMNNDRVNLISSCAGGLLAAGLAALLL